MAFRRRPPCCTTFAPGQWPFRRLHVPLCLHCGPYREVSEARFVLSSNFSEEAGLPDLESTKQVLALQRQCKDCRLSTGSIPCTAESREVTQFGATVHRALAYGQELEDYGNHQEADLINIYECCVVTPDIVEGWHSILMQGLVYNAGTVRSGYAYAGLSDGSRHYYVDPEVVPCLWQATCDYHNASLHVLAKECGHIVSVEASTQLYNLAALVYRALRFRCTLFRMVMVAWVDCWWRLC